jgi:hypothetical protein
MIFRIGNLKVIMSNDKKKEKKHRKIKKERKEEKTGHSFFQTPNSS